MWRGWQLWQLKKRYVGGPAAPLITEARHSGGSGGAWGAEGRSWVAEGAEAVPWMDRGGGDEGG